MTGPPDPEMRNRPAGDGTAYRGAFLKKPKEITETTAEVQARKLRRLYQANPPPSRIVGEPMTVPTRATATSLRELGFREKGAIWKGAELYYFSIRTGIGYQPDCDQPNMFRVAFPDASLSVDSYNLPRVKQHCRDVAHSIYPRPSGSTSAHSDMAGAARDGVRSLK